MEDPQDITLRPLARTGFALLRRWLEVPHVRRWWDHGSSPEAVETEMAPDDPIDSRAHRICRIDRP